MIIVKEYEQLCEMLPDTCMYPVRIIFVIEYVLPQYKLFPYFSISLANVLLSNLILSFTFIHKNVLN
jgi:hypothetical protein